MKFLFDYDPTDLLWADWIGWTLRGVGHEVYVREWEVEAGQNTEKWAARRMKDCEKCLGLFSPSYIQAVKSKPDDRPPYWDGLADRDGFLVPIIIEPCMDLPSAVRPLKRLHLYDIPEQMAALSLIKFLAPPSIPIIKPPFPSDERV